MEREKGAGMSEEEKPLEKIGNKLLWVVGGLLIKKAYDLVSGWLFPKKYRQKRKRVVK